MLPEPDANNVWRLETPGNEGWLRSARPDAADKFYMASADGHVQEPSDLWVTRMDARYRDRLPGVIVDAKGDQLPEDRGLPCHQDAERRARRATRLLRNKSGRTPEERVRDLALDGVDAEILFPNKGLTMWATRDAAFSQAMCRVYNDWAWETFGPVQRHARRRWPASPPPTSTGAIAEIQRCAALGLPRVCRCRASRSSGRPTTRTSTTTCVSSSRCGTASRTSTCRSRSTCRPAVTPAPPAARAAPSSTTPSTRWRRRWSRWSTSAPRAWPSAIPKLRFGSVEAGIGWVPWALTAMDEAYRKHHMWVKPKLELLPSEYFRRQGFATFQEDKPGLDLAREHGLVDNFLWANDFPHHEGTWPYSAQAIERTMGDLDDGERAKILGLNMARIFRLPIPERYLDHADAAATQAGVAVGTRS